MTIEEAKEKYSNWANIELETLMFLKEDSEAFYFMYKRKYNYFKIAVSKIEDAFYSMSDTLTSYNIEKYDNQIETKKDIK